MPATSRVVWEGHLPNIVCVGEFGAIIGILGKHWDSSQSVPLLNVGDTLLVVDRQEWKGGVVSDTGLYFWYAIGIVRGVSSGYPS